jgi:hypothetical protein
LPGISLPFDGTVFTKDEFESGGGLQPGWPLSVSGMREVEISQFVRTIADGEGTYDPAREGLAHAIAVVLKQLTEDGDVIVRATHEDVTEIMQRMKGYAAPRSGSSTGLKPGRLKS